MRKRVAEMLIDLHERLVPFLDRSLSRSSSSNVTSRLTLSRTRFPLAARRSWISAALRAKLRMKNFIYAAAAHRLQHELRKTRHRPYPRPFLHASNPGSCKFLRRTPTAAVLGCLSTWTTFRAILVIVSIDLPKICVLSLERIRSKSIVLV